MMAEDKKKHAHKHQDEPEIEETAGLETDQDPVKLQEVITILVGELDEANKKADETLESLQRSRADFANYKKQQARFEEQRELGMRVDILKKYLSIQDDMELALRNRPTEGVDGAWAEGVALIARKLKNLLDGENLIPVANPGDAFDPNVHEAITFEPSDKFGSHEIIEVIQQGYKLGDRVVRPAMVRVAQ